MLRIAIVIQGQFQCSLTLIHQGEQKCTYLHNGAAPRFQTSPYTEGMPYLVSADTDPAPERFKQCVAARNLLSDPTRNVAQKMQNLMQLAHGCMLHVIFAPTSPAEMLCSAIMEIFVLLLQLMD